MEAICCLFFIPFLFLLVGFIFQKKQQPSNDFRKFVIFDSAEITTYILRRHKPKKKHEIVLCFDADLMNHYHALDTNNS